MKFHLIAMAAVAGWLVSAAHGAQDALVLLEGSSAKVSKHLNGRITYDRSMRLLKNVTLKEMSKNQGAYVPAIAVSLSDQNTFYFINAKNRLRYRLELQRTDASVTLPPNPSEAEIVRASDTAYRKLLVVDGVQSKQGIGIYRYGSPTQFMRAVITPTEGMRAFSIEADPQLHLFHTMQDYLAPFMRLMLTKAPHEERVTGESGGNVQVELTDQMLGTKYYATMTRERFDLLSYAQGSELYKGSGEHRLIRIAYSDYRSMGGESLPGKIIVNQYTTDPNVPPPARAEDKQMQMLCAEFVIRDAQFDKPEFEQKVSFADFEGQSVSDERYVTSDGESIGYDYSSDIKEKELLKLKTQQEKSIAERQRRLPSHAVKYAIMALSFVLASVFFYRQYRSVE